MSDTAKFCDKCGTRVDFVMEENKVDEQVKRTEDENIQGNVPVIEKNRRKKWYQKTGGIIFWLIVFFPVGLYMMWKYADWKKIVKIVISTICMCSIIMGFFSGDDQDISPAESGSQRMVGNVEPGLGQMGARFNMDLETFTEKLNIFYDTDLFDFENWHFDGQIPQEGSEEVFDMYSYQISNNILMDAVIESSTGKINSINICGPFNDGTEDEERVIITLIHSTLSVLADVDEEKGSNIMSEVIDNNSSLPAVYENICMKFTSSSIFMIVPASDEVLGTMQYTEID